MIPGLDGTGGTFGGGSEKQELDQELDQVPNWKSAKVPNRSSSFFLEKPYLMTALSSNTKGQHFLARNLGMGWC